MFYRVVPDFARCCPVLLGLARFYWVWLDFVAFFFKSHRVFNWESDSCAHYWWLDTKSLANRLGLMEFSCRADLSNRLIDRSISRLLANSLSGGHVETIVSKQFLVLWMLTFPSHFNRIWVCFPVFHRLWTGSFSSFGHYFGIIGGQKWGLPSFK